MNPMNVSSVHWPKFAY